MTREGQIKGQTGRYMTVGRIEEEERERGREGGRERERERERSGNGRINRATFESFGVFSNNNIA